MVGAAVSHRQARLTAHGVAECGCGVSQLRAGSLAEQGAPLALERVRLRLAAPLRVEDARLAQRNRALGLAPQSELHPRAPLARERRVVDEVLLLRLLGRLLV